MKTLRSGKCAHSDRLIGKSSTPWSTQMQWGMIYDTVLPKSLLDRKRAVIYLSSVNCFLEMQICVCVHESKNVGTWAQDSSSPPSNLFRPSVAKNAIFKRAEVSYNSHNRRMLSWQRDSQWIYGKIKMQWLPKVQSPFWEPAGHWLQMVRINSQGKRLPG